MAKLTLLVMGLLLLIGCGKKGTVTPELLRISSFASSRAVHSEGFDPRAGGVNVNSSLTIVSLKVPIRSISLQEDSSGGGGEQIYDCAADTNDGCLVDLAAESELQNLLSSAGATEASVGTYAGIQISTCKEGGAYTGKIKASGTTDPNGGGSTLYTQVGDGALTTDVASWGEASVYFSGCSRYYPLPQPVTVVEGQSIDVKLYFDIRDIAFFGDAANAGSNGTGNEAWFAGGYSYTYPASPSGTYVGVNYLDVEGTVDSGSPTVSRYRFASSYGHLGTIGLIYTSGGDYIGGYTRSYFSADSTTGFNDMVTPIRIYTDNGDGTFTIGNYGSSADTTYVQLTDFQKTTTSYSGSYTDDSGQARTYTLTALAR